MVPILDAVSTVVQLTRGNPPALVILLVVLFAVAQGAVFRWCDGLGRFRLRRVLELRDLLAPGAPGGERLREALTARYEAEVYARYLGAPLDQVRRATLDRLFADRGLALDFALAERFLPYVRFSPDGAHAHVLNPEAEWRGVRWRRVRNYAATVAYFAGGGVAALCFAAGLYYAPKSPATSAAAIMLGLFPLVGAAFMLPPIWNYRGLRKFYALPAPPPNTDPAAHDASEERPPVKAGLGALSVAAGSSTGAAAAARVGEKPPRIPRGVGRPWLAAKARGKRRGYPPDALGLRPRGRRRTRLPHA